MKGALGVFMKNVILVLVFLGVNIVLFQNFTNMTDEEKKSWGTIEETEVDNYGDFKSALDNARADLKDKKEAWEDDLEENEDVSLDQEVGSITKLNEERDE